MFGTLKNRVQKAIGSSRAGLLDRDAIERTLEHLVAEGAIAEDRAASLRAVLPLQIDRSSYVLGHLGAHLGIGAVFAFDLVPLPLGTIGRVAWVAGCRAVETARHRPEHARVHSLAVLLLAAVPWLGYSAYLLPLRRESGELAFILANRIWLDRTGNTYEESVARAGAPVQRIARWLVPFPVPAAVPKGQPNISVQPARWKDMRG